MKGIAFLVTMPFLISSVGCSEYHNLYQERGMDLTLQDSSYISHDAIVNYLCGEVGVYRCPHRTPKHPVVLDPVSLGQVIKTKSDAIIKTRDHIYYFSSGSGYIRPGDSLGQDKNLDIDSIEASTDTRGPYLYNLALAQKRINAAIRVVGLNGQSDNIKHIMFVKCCYGEPGVLPPIWRDRYVIIRFKQKT